MTMLGRAIAGARSPASATIVLGLALGLLVGVAERLAGVELALAERAARGGRPT